MGKMSEEDFDRIRWRVNNRAPLEQRDAFLLFEHIETLEAEKSELQQQVPQMVVLPKEVASALENTIPGGENPDLDYYIWSIIRFDVNDIEIKSKNYDTLFNYANEHERGITNLVRAVRFGYTIEPEPTTEDKLKANWSPAMEKVLHEYVGNAAPEATKEIIDKIMPITREIIKTEELKHDLG